MSCYQLLKVVVILFKKKNCSYQINNYYNHTNFFSLYIYFFSNAFETLKDDKYLSFF